MKLFFFFLKGIYEAIKNKATPRIQTMSSTSVVILQYDLFTLNFLF
jgi:hypothetical protein